MASNEWKFRLTGQGDWNKSLRGLIPNERNVKRVKTRRSMSSGDERPPTATKAQKVRKLSLVEEEVFSQDNENNDGKKRKTSRAEASAAAAAAAAPAPVRPLKRATKAPRKRLSSCDQVVENLNLDPKDLERVDREVIISPVPLPPGVVCIDPPYEEDPWVAFCPDAVKYLRGKEKGWVWPVDVILGEKKELADQRQLLMNWLIELAAHFRHSQETLYHAVGLIDSTLAKRDVQDENLQLLAIASLFLASKLEEYYPPTIEDLLELTENSYTRQELLLCERKLLQIHDFNVYSAEPMVFINRFLQAAFKRDDDVFVQTCVLLFDSMIPCIEYSSILASKKAAAAVFAARVLWPEASEPRWTPTLSYYSGYAENDIYLLGFQMIDQLVKCLKLGLAKGKDCGLLRKYKSRSLHGGLLRRPDMQLEAIQQKMKSVAKN